MMSIIRRPVAGFVLVMCASTSFAATASSNTCATEEAQAVLSARASSKMLMETEMNDRTRKAAQDLSANPSVIERCISDIMKKGAGALIKIPSLSSIGQELIQKALDSIAESVCHRATSELDTAIGSINTRINKELDASTSELLKGAGIDGYVLPEDISPEVSLGKGSGVNFEKNTSLKSKIERLPDAAGSVANKKLDVLFR